MKLLQFQGVLHVTLEQNRVIYPSVLSYYRDKMSAVKRPIASVLTCKAKMEHNLSVTSIINQLA